MAEVVSDQATAPSPLSATRTPNVAEEGLPYAETVAEVAPNTGTPSANTSRRGVRQVSLGGNATSGRRIAVRNAQRDDTRQPRIGDAVQLGNPNPLRRIAQVLRGNAKEVAPDDLNGLHANVSLDDGWRATQPFRPSLVSQLVVLAKLAAARPR
jgi:hypothetical protein